MGNSVRKTRMVRVLPEPNAELLPMDSRILEELGHGRGRRYFRPKYRDIINTMHILTALIGNFNSPYRKLGRAGLLLWLLSMSINFMYDGYESRVKYGYPWMSVRGLLWITCCLGTWFTIRRTMPWFEQNLCKLENDKLYRRVLQDMSGTTEKLPYFLVLFSLAAGSLQYGIMRRDQATHLAFGKTPHDSLGVVLHVLRFISGVHVYYALALFWSVPTCVMLMAGYSMIEYQDLTASRLKFKSSPLTLRQAVESYNERVKFVQDSSSACVVILCVLIAFSVTSLAVNAYVFLFLHRSLYLYIVQALLPLVLATYPLSTASWVTKQYHWHLVAVVKAWVEISDSDSDSDDEQQQKTISAHSTRESSADRHELWAPQSPLRIHMPDTGHVIVRPYNQDEVKRLKNVFSGSAQFIGKLQQKRTRSKFQFEKYITYLEKVSRNVGFSIGVVLVTWDLVSTVFFFLISLIALFVQESIFGKTKSTISI